MILQTKFSRLPERRFMININQVLLIAYMEIHDFINQVLMIAWKEINDLIN